ncbi:MAG: aromatic amino acid ammonia-lyase [Pseudomonadota bacterium]
MTQILISEDADYQLEDVRTTLDEDVCVRIDSRTLQQLDESFEVFSSGGAISSPGSPVYGLDTGLGPMVTTPIDRTQLPSQQRQLLLSHASGFGAPLNWQQARAALFARACSMSRNRSAVRSLLPTTMAKLLSAGVAPYIPRHGGVGASGDLVQLAHLGLLLVGEGDALLPNNQASADYALEIAGCDPIELVFRDGLAIVNGLSAMTGVGLVAVIDAMRLVDVAFQISALMAEIVGAGEEPFSAALSSVKKSNGQGGAAYRLRHLMAESPALLRHTDYDAHNPRPLQEHYSIRCTPQILGAINQAIENARDTLLDELNSVSDNPVFFADDRAIVHGGNFHGEPIAMAMDAMKIAVVKLTVLMERQLNFLLHDGINQILPAFLNGGTKGVEFGFQGAQFTATSTTAHNQSLAFPMSAHSITCNRDNQDIVSMGCDAALMTADTIANAEGVAAITSMAVAEAVRLLSLEQQISPTGRRFISAIAGNAEAGGTGKIAFYEALAAVKSQLFTSGTTLAEPCDAKKTLSPPALQTVQ